MRVRRNYLYDINTDSLITNIRSCKPMPYQSYGGISTTWRYDSQVALITYNDRWAPRDACLVSVNGAQINVYNQIQRDARAYLANRDINFLKNKNNLVVDFFRNDYLLRMTNNRLTVLATVYTPKSRVYSQSLLMNYRYQVIGTLIEFHLVDIQRT
ncbi:MAG: hypothetical protein IGS39_15790 [Calothrix sp. C42_A2020_038]|nr:hypothetical protein [Calothrix sp. C42_A2020_038]